jgi:hypothetical protein
MQAIDACGFSKMRQIYLSGNEFAKSHEWGSYLDTLVQEIEDQFIIIVFSFFLSAYTD